MASLSSGFLFRSIFLRIVSARAKGGLNFSGSEAKQEEVLRSYLIANFNVCAMERANSDGPIHRELHIARPPEASFPAVEICSDTSAAG